MTTDDAQWTEGELDDALARLNIGEVDELPGHSGAKHRLIAFMDEEQTEKVVVPLTSGGVRTRSRRLRLWSMAASVLVVAGLFTVLMVSPSTPLGPASAEAVATLTHAADQVPIHATDTPLTPGEYRYIATRSWSLREIGSTNEGPASFLAETLIEVWMPADPEDEWLMERTETGRKIWVQGSEPRARESGLLVDYPPPAGLDRPIRARCGDFYAVLENRPPCDFTGSWQIPLATFVAGLPRDPDMLYERLQRDAPDDDRGDSQALTYAADALRDGLIPADLRSSLYKTLSRLRGLQVTEDTANLDGQQGTALGIDDGSRRQDLIIEPDTGEFIGERQVLTEESDSGIPAGTVVRFSSVISTVVTAVGARP